MYKSLPKFSIAEIVDTPVGAGTVIKHEWFELIDFKEFIGYEILEAYWLYDVVIKGVLYRFQESVVSKI